MKHKIRRIIKVLKKEDSFSFKKKYNDNSRSIFQITSNYYSFYKKLLKIIFYESKL